MKLGTIIALVGLWLAIGIQPTQAQSANQVGLVVRHGDGSVVTRCVDFNEPQINGYDLLQRSGLDLNVEVMGMGAAVCRLDHEGCSYPQESCFCQTEGDAYSYWSYWRQAENGWHYSTQGASNAQIMPGTVEGWVWGSSTINAANPPPAITFAEVCAPPTATPSATPTETPTPSPTATLIPVTATPTGFPPTLTPLPTQPAPPSATWTPIPTATWTPIPTGTSIGTVTPALPRIELFAVDHTVLEVGQSAKLSWIARDTGRVQLQSNGTELVLGPVGNLDVQPLQSTTYTLIARNLAGEVSATVSITLNPAAVISSATPGVELAALPPTMMPVPPATPLPTVIPLPTATVLPTPTASTLPTMVAIAVATIPVTASVPPDNGARAPVAPIVTVSMAWVTATPDPAQAQLQTLMLFGGVVLVLVIPMGLLAVVVLVWAARRQA